MNRRSVIATVALTGLSGCVTSSSSDSPDDQSNEADESSGPMEVIDDFGDLEPWDVTGGEITATRTSTISGQKGIHVDVGESDTTTRLVREFDEALDFSAATPGLAVRTREMAVPWIRLIDDYGRHADFRRGITPGLSLMRYNFGIESIQDRFDWSRVSTISIRLWTSVGQTRAIWLDELHRVDRPDRGKVMIQFDDGHITDYTEARPRLAAHGIPAVTFVNKDYVDGGTVAGFPRIERDHLHTLHDDGWCLANHTADHPHLSELDRAEQRAEILEGKDWLREMGYEDGARVFAYPFGDYNQTTLELVDEYHDLAYAGGHPVHGTVVNRRLTPRISEPTAAEAREVLRLTASLGGITAIFYHRLEGQLLADFEAMVEELVRLLERDELDVVLPSDIAEQHLTSSPR